MRSVILNIPEKTVKIGEFGTDKIYMEGPYYQWKYLPDYTGIEVTMDDETIPGISSLLERKTVIISFNQGIVSIIEG